MPTRAGKPRLAYCEPHRKLDATDLVSPGGNGASRVVLLLPICLPYCIEQVTRDDHLRNRVRISIHDGSLPIQQTAPSVPCQSGHQQFIDESIRTRRLSSVCGHGRERTRVRGRKKDETKPNC